MIAYDRSLNSGFKALAFLLILLTACDKPDDVKWVNYDETKCADRWAYDNNNENLKNNITNYCKSKGIEIFELEIFVDGDPESCNACTCKSGRRVHAKVSTGDVSNIKNEGFYE